MQITLFQRMFSVYPIFSLKDVLKRASGFHRIQLDRWEKKGYLEKIKRGYYRLVGQESSQNFLFYTANRIYSPSYVSLEMGLKFYGLIPEEIFQITSVSTKKATHFETPVGNFSYRHLKPSLFWGYRLVDFENQNEKQKILLADPEKALLDYIYLHPHLKTPDDFRGMRINADEFRAQVDLGKFHRYLEAFESKALTKRATLFLVTLHDDNA